MIKKIVTLVFYDMVFFVILSLGYGFTIKTWSVSMCCGFVLVFLVDILQRLVRLEKQLIINESDPTDTTQIKYPRRDINNIKYKNVILMLKDQLPLKNFLCSLFSGHIFRKFNLRSHLRFNGLPKIMYSSKEKAIKAKHSMESKNRGTGFAAYKCVYCDGFHIGANVYKLDQK